MYHLLVTAQSDAWDGSRYTYNISRVIRQFTDEVIKQKYQSLDESIIAELQSLPTLFAYEEHVCSAAKLGFIKRIQQRSNEVRIEYDFFSNAPLISAEVISKLSWELEIGHREMDTTHWAIKASDLFQVLLEGEIITNEQLRQLTAQLKEIAPIKEAQFKGMSKEDVLNSGLVLLMLLSQAYYKMLESTTSISDWCSYLDLELNDSYLWTTKNIKNLLENNNELKDFPIKFEPLFPDLYPTTIQDIDWQDMVAPEADRFLSTVQKYVSDKGAFDPEEGSSAWIFLELFRPGVNTAIERAIAYNKKMVLHVQRALGHSPKSTENSASDSPKGSQKKTEKESENRNFSSQRDKIFISYSHRDKKYLSELQTHLKPLQRAGRVTVWSDLQIKPGSKWLQDIQKALKATKVAVLLVTKDFLASDFIIKNELTPLLKAAEEEGVVICWALVRDCNWKMTPIKDYQAVYSTEKPLAGLGWKRDSAWVEMSQSIEKICNR